MNFIRRVLLVLGIASAAGAILRLKGKSEPSTQRGGWRPLVPPVKDPSTDPISNQSSSQH